MMIVGTLYSHQVNFDLIVNELKRKIPKGEVKVEEIPGGKNIYLKLKGGLFKKNKSMKIVYRQRDKPSYFLGAPAGCALTKNLLGLDSFVQGIETKHHKHAKKLLLQKIQTLNSEISIHVEPELTNEFKSFISFIAIKLDAIMFVQPNTPISQAEGQHFLDKNLKLLFDTRGNGHVPYIDVIIDKEYIHKHKAENLKEDQIIRKSKNEAFLNEHNFKLNRILHIESEDETIIRTPLEIAQRVIVLVVKNLVAFNHIKADAGLEYFTKHNIKDFLSIMEVMYFVDDAEDIKNKETWKSEGIWVLMWALGYVEELPFPNKMVDLSEIPRDVYPAFMNPHKFIEMSTRSRTKKEIMDANDLYYRMNWACTDARIHGHELENVIPGVVWERHYALNWLINYMGQSWDDISCDT